MEPSEAQYLIINALDTLELLGSHFYDEERGDWYIQTSSKTLPNSIIQQNGDIIPITWRSE